MVQEIQPSATEKPKNKALHFVLGMGGAVLGACLICGLVWWIASDHSFHNLGRYINIAGIIFIVFGITTLVDRKTDYGIRYKREYHSPPPGFEEKRKQSEKYRKMSGDDKQASRLVMFLGGVGILCLFIGNLIFLGL